MKFFLRQTFLASALILISCFVGLNTVFAQIQDSITVTATVPPHATDFQFNLAGSTNNSQDILSYQIIYGAKPSAGMQTDMVLVAEWGGGEYVEGSASNAYGETKPVVSSDKHTITWRVPSLPQGTLDQKVNFQLKAISITSDLESKIFTTTAKMSNQYLSLPDQKFTNLLTAYLYTSKSEGDLSYLPLKTIQFIQQ